MADHRTGIVTDSTADIPAAYLNQFNIRVVPALITIDGQTFQDNEQFDRAGFYNKLRNYRSVPTTAAPSPAVFTSAYNELFRDGCQHVISMHVSGELSGICDMAISAARDFANRVHVFDSGQLSLGLGFQVLEAAAAAQAGEPLKQILEMLPKIKQRIRVLAMINKLDYLRRSGRVNWATAGIGSWLRVKMVVGLKDGIVQRLAAVRTRAKALRAMGSRVREWGPLQRIAVMHTGIYDEAAAFAESLDLQGTGSATIIDATTVIGTHIGEGSIGVAGLVR